MGEPLVPERGTRGANMAIDQKLPYIYMFVFIDQQTTQKKGKQYKQARNAWKALERASTVSFDHHETGKGLKTSSIDESSAHCRVTPILHQMKWDGGPKGRKSPQKGYETASSIARNQKQDEKAFNVRVERKDRSPGQQRLTHGEEEE